MLFVHVAAVLLSLVLVAGSKRQRTAAAPPPTVTEIRNFAANCYEAASFSQPAAAALFNQRYSGAIARPGRFCKKWHEQRKRTGSVNNRPGQGRKRKVSAEDAKQAAFIFRQGTAHGRPADNFASVKEACAESDDFNKIRLRSANGGPLPCDRTMLRAMRRALPTLATRTLRYKPPLSSKNRKWRLSTAKKNLQRMHDNPTYFDRVVWVDSKTIWSTPPKHRTVWVDTAMLQPGDLVVTSQGLTSSGKKKAPRVRLEYYACVNSILGPIDMCFVTGTTGRKPRFKASPCCPAVPHLPLPAFSHHRQPPT